MTSAALTPIPSPIPTAKFIGESEPDRMAIVELLRNDRGEIIVKPLREASPDITPDFVQAVDSFMAEYADVLRRLADR